MNISGFWMNDADNAQKPGEYPRQFPPAAGAEKSGKTAPPTRRKEETDAEKTAPSGKERNHVMIDKDKISPAVIGRLSRYYRFLRALNEEHVERVSSAQLSVMMDLTASQIRQDFNCFGGFGQQGYGYNVAYLFGELKKLLGAEEGYTAAIVGAGNLGAALAHAQTFTRRGVTVTAMFDISAALVGGEVAGLPVYHPDDFGPVYAARPFDIVVLCVPKDAAQECADRLTALGVKALWNFTGVEIRVPEDCIVENVHLGDSLLTLSYKLRVAQNKKADGERPPEGN